MDESFAFLDTSAIDCAICATDCPAPWISAACFCAACSSLPVTLSASCVALVTCCEALVMPATRRRNSSMV
ncbi:hypothetical protein D3C83_160040 [compost metagenome]